MKIAFDTGHPFKWADGGIRVQYESLSKALANKGVDVEPIIWWNKSQNYDLVQTFYYPNNITRLALKKKIKVVSYINLDGYTTHNYLKLNACITEIKFIKKFRPSIADRLGWRMSEISSHFIVPVLDEIKYLKKLFDIKEKKASSIMHGVDNKFLVNSWSGRSERLITVGSICRRKNSLFLAKLANDLKIPITFIGKFQETDSDYCKKFLIEAEKNYVEHLQNINHEKKLELLKNSRAFINLSRGESGCIAVLEAFALKMPVILPFLPWAYQAYKKNAFFVDIRSYSKAKKQLDLLIKNKLLKKEEYIVFNWEEVASKYLSIYESVIKK